MNGRRKKEEIRSEEVRCRMRTDIQNDPGKEVVVDSALGLSGEWKEDQGNKQSMRLRKEEKGNQPSLRQREQEHLLGTRGSVINGRSYHKRNRRRGGNQRAKMSVRWILIPTGDAISPITRQRASPHETLSAPQATHPREHVVFSFEEFDHAKREYHQLLPCDRNTTKQQNEMEFEGHKNSTRQLPDENDVAAQLAIDQGDTTHKEDGKNENRDIEKELDMFQNRFSHASKSASVS